VPDDPSSAAGRKSAELSGKTYIFSLFREAKASKLAWRSGPREGRVARHPCTKKFKIKKEAFPTTYSKVAGNGLDRQS